MYVQLLFRQIKKLTYASALFMIVSCANSKHTTQINQSLELKKRSAFEIGKEYYYNFTEETIQSKWDTAALYFRKCLQDDTLKRRDLTEDEKTAFFWLAGIYYYKGDFERLQSLSKVVMRLYPDYSIRYNIGMYFDTLSRYYKNPEFDARYTSYFRQQLGLNTKEEYNNARKLLEEVADKDQVFRKQLLNSKGDIENISDAIDNSIAKADSANLLIVSGLINKYGWLGIEDVGLKASEGEFLVIQHADSAVFVSYQSVIERAYGNKKLSRSDYELYIDRLNVFLHKYQIYGTQQYYDSTEKRWILYPTIQTNKK